MKIERLVIVTILVLSSRLISAQGIQMEPMVGHNGFYYQHIIGTPFDGHTGLGILNISSASARYSKSPAPELMSQIYLTRQVWQELGVGAGMIYVTGVGMRTTAMAQILKTKKNFTLVLFPRIDLWKNPSMELMTIMEYRPKIASNLTLYSRLQLQTIWNKEHHLKSSQHLRVGLDMGGIQFGLATVLEEYGAGFSTYQNYGLFIRKEIKSFPTKEI
ncbi:hypothetical protein J2X69_002624 [Algoriphagus sp. 4150]|uniref:hypothetical protein n=1 Tax=Algoriphagus sp. 4150 TaxID=2817756 RepID=UPI00285BC96D|nr:hypothetical protein [Algoriphagus sp. 4150]MDR7130276.1 hypothetical protein [Algoriphagus sp. 4150]